MTTLGYHGMMLMVVACFALPLLWMLAASLRQPGLPPSRTLEWWPTPLAWSNYLRIFEIVPLGRYIWNSLVVALLAVPITLVTASWAGFAMAQLPAQPRRLLAILAVVLRMVPITALWLTRFILFSYLALIDTLWALVATAWMGSSPLFVLLFYWTFRRISSEVYEAARLDGLGVLRSWALIGLPLARPTVAAVAVLTFVQYWSDFINPLLYLKSEQLYTMPVGLQVLKQLDQSNWPLLLAAAVVMIAPVLLLFFVLQRAFWPHDRDAGR